MEQIISVQSASAQPTLRGLLGLNGGQAVQGDAFAMLFQQLMGQDGDFAALFTQVTQDNQEEANKLGAQMAAEMLCMMPNPQMQMMLSLVQPQAMAQVVENIQDVLDGKTAGANLTAAQLLSALGTQGEEAAPTAKNLTSNQFYTILQNAWKEEEPQQPFMGLSFQDSSLRAAKELLAQKQKDNTVQPLDVESLQADVNAKRFMPLDAMAQKQAASLPDVNEIANQLKTGILDNVAQGKNEFVVRLKPEGIGEIVVKLSENKEKISLSIITSSAQTAKMITNEVTALQNALRPLHAEVEQIVVAQPTEQASNYAAQTAMTNQEHQFQGQQFYNGQGDSHHGGSSRPQEGGEFGSTVEQILAEDDGLDTYI